jgi:hypothetical protein
MENLEELLNETKVAYVVKSTCDDYQDLIVLVTRFDNCYVEMTVVEPCSWDANNHKNLAVQYITSAKVKFDLCSHFYYTGEDSFTEEPDSYYHVCGDSAYLTMIITQCAILHIAKELIEKNDGPFNCGYKFVETLSKFMEIFEKEYEVTEINLKEWNIVKYVHA